MSLLHPSSVGAPVGLWFSNGAPVRLVHAGTRFRVLSAQPVADGWTLRATDAMGRQSEFTVAVNGNGWELRSAR